MKRRSIGLTISLILAPEVGLLFAGQADVDPSVVRISNGPQLFLDDFLIARMKNLKRELQQPRKHAANPLIVQEFPWEKRTLQVYGTVIYEPRPGRFRCWYIASADPEARPEYYMCYAESPDGLHWNKPMVGLPGLWGYDRHNIVVPGGHGLCVLSTPGDPDPDRRYKGLGGDILAFSPDGIQWSMEPFEAAGKNDTASSVVFFQGEYLAYVRNQERPPDWPAIMRAVALSTSTDFRHWTDKKTILMTDKQDGYPWTQPYGMEVSVYGDQLIGLLPLLYLDHVKGNNVLGDMRVQLAASRDGRVWHRVADRATFLEPTREPTGRAWDGGMVFPSTTMFVKDDQVYIYYTGSDRRHGEGKPGRKGIGLATLAADRFAALVPASTGVEGVLQTRPLSLAGRDLLVNARITAGDLKVELLDGAGRVLPGFDRDRCRLVVHDPLRYRVVFPSKGGSKSLRDVDPDQPLALRFFLRKGALYAFQVAADQAAPSSQAATAGDGPQSAGAWATARSRGGIYAECARNARKLLHGWITLKRDPETHLYCRQRQWDYHNQAADHYSSLVFIAYFVEPSLLEQGGTLHRTLMNSITLCTTPSGLPATYDLTTKTRGESNVGQIAEWLRDGLIRITEIMGTDNDWYRELERLTDAVIAVAGKQGGPAKILRGPEDLGNMMQTLSRLCAMSGKEKYILAAEEIADDYLLVDPLARIKSINFVDHGCELVPGLAEVFVMERKLGRPRAGQYHQAMRRLLDRILEVGRHSESGLWYRKANLTGRPRADQGKPTKAPRAGVGGAAFTPDVPDTWGYVLFAFENYDRATGENRYRLAVEKPMRWLVENRPNFETLKNTLWTPTFNHDTWSDSYESMIVLWRRYPDVAGVFDWLDWMTIRGGHRDEADGPFGPGSGAHDDGSTGRTLGLHMMLCSQGVRAIPWAKGLGCGAVKKNGDLYLSLGSEVAWEGRLCFDWPRNEHRGATIDWARINETPQWFVVRPKCRYQVFVDDARPVTLDGTELIKGLRISLSRQQTRRIRVQEENK